MANNKNEQSGMYVDHVINTYKKIDKHITDESNNDLNRLLPLKVLQLNRLRQEYNRLWDYVQQYEQEVDKLLKQ